MLEISSSKNPTIKKIKSLYKKKDRWKEKQFIIEGIKTVGEAIDSSVSLEHILFSNELFDVDGGLEFFESIKDREETVKLPENLFREISDLENPQGVMGVVNFKKGDINKIKDISSPFIIFLDRLNDPGNLGTIIRSADAFGADGIVIGEGTVDPYNSKVVRATMGSLFRMPIYDVGSNEKFFNEMKNSNVSIITTSLDGEVLEEEDLSAGIVIAIGNEANGVGEETLENSNKSVKIPMVGGTESLNAGVAASIIMYEAMKGRN